MAGCLGHLRVLDLSRIFAGPWAGQFFGDLGADVIKVEVPGRGDDVRQSGPPFLKDAEGRDSRESAQFMSVNRNKRSITVDLSKPEGQDIIRQLAAQCDVLIENYKVGTLARYNLAYEDIAKVNPRLVYCSITGFGQSGPYSHRPGYDMVFQAMSGLMSVTGERDDRPGGGPQRAGYSSSDMSAGMYAITAILAALHHREAVSGRGQHIDLALLDSQVALLSHVAANYFMTGNVPGRLGNVSANASPWGTFPCADDDVVLAVGNDTQFQRLCETMGRAELAADPRFLTTPDRVRRRDELTDVLNEEFRKRRALEWVEMLDAAGVPCGPIYNMEQMLRDPQVRARGLEVVQSHPLGAEVHTIANPIKLSGTPVSNRLPPPMQGEHTHEVLTGLLGMDEAQLQALRAARVV
ncbi:MAG: CoA transferase [Burkholderiales bacterium]|jgi:crotonobetainyl-CoA:carnitine CoA-transferase CaiB-like acyl-CoA transferase|nr:CoA transferase [Burkholderiales bacterium]